MRSRLGKPMDTETDFSLKPATVRSERQDELAAFLLSDAFDEAVRSCFAKAVAAAAAGEADAITKAQRHS
jgi:hypothetical protein